MWCSVWCNICRSVCACLSLCVSLTVCVSHCLSQCGSHSVPLTVSHRGCWLSQHHKKYQHDESKMSRRAAAVAIAAAEGIELNSPKSPHSMVLTPKGSKSKKGGRNSLLKESAARNATKAEARAPAAAQRPSGGPPVEQSRRSPRGSDGPPAR